MKQVIAGPVADQPFDLRLVSTLYQIEQQRRLERNAEGIGIRRNLATLESYAAGLTAFERVSGAAARLRLRQILRREDPGRYAPIARMRGFQEVLFGWISTLIGENLPPEALEGSLADLAGIYRIFTHALRRDGIRTREMILQEAVRHAAELRGMRVLVSGFLDFRAVELDFLDALAQHNHVVLQLPAYGKDRFTDHLKRRLAARGWMCPDPAEAKDAAPIPYITADTPRLLAHRIVTELLQENTPETDVVVTDDSLREEIIRTAEEAGLPLATGAALQAHQTRVGRESLRLAAIPPGTERVLPAVFSEYAADDPAHSAKDPAVYLEAVCLAYRDRILGRAKDPADALNEWHGANAVLEALTEWKAIGAEAADLRHFLQDRLEETSIPARGCLSGIRLLSPRESANLSVGRRIFAGYGRDFPETESSNFLLRETAELSGLILSPREQYYKEKRRMDDAIEQAQTVLFALQTEDGMLSVSPLAAGRIGGEKPSVSESRVPAAGALLSEKDRAMFAAAQPGAAQPVPFAAVRSQRINPGWMPKLGGGSYSAGALDTYTLCPFRYWLEYVVGVEPEEGGVQLLRGVIVHEVLAAYYTQMRDSINHALACGLSPKPDSDRLARLLQEAAAAQEDPFPRALLAQMQQQLLDYIRADLQRLESTAGYRVGEVETPFSVKMKGSAGSIRLTGRIDRMDTSLQGEPDWIADYKTGNLPTCKQIGRGEAFQLPLYSLSRTPPAHVYYGGLKEGKIAGVQMPAAYPMGRTKPFPRREWVDLLETLKEQIVSIDRRIRDGHFPVTPSDSACAYCSHAAVCRKEELE